MSKIAWKNTLIMMGKTISLIHFGGGIDSVFLLLLEEYLMLLLHLLTVRYSPITALINTRRRFKIKKIKTLNFGFVCLLCSSIPLR